MNTDNSNKVNKGTAAKNALEDLLIYLSRGQYLLSYEKNKKSKYGYEGKKEDQFKCDFVINLFNEDKWILFSAASLTTDRLKTKQWDAEHIKKLDRSVKKAFVICPDTTDKNDELYRYREYIRNKQYVSSVDDILFYDEFVERILDAYLGEKQSGKKAAVKGIEFEFFFKTIMENKQNLERWKGDENVTGLCYASVFEKVVRKLSLLADEVERIEADNNIAQLPIYKYKNGVRKMGGNPKTDVCLTFFFNDASKKTYTFSCKNTGCSQVTVLQFPPEYCVDLLEIEDPRVKVLIERYVEAGGCKKMSRNDQTELSQRLSTYLDKFNKWVLHGSERDNSTPIQRADYIIARYRYKGEKLIRIETVDECIARREGKGTFGTAFSWTVTSDGKYPVMKLELK